MSDGHAPITASFTGSLGAFNLDTSFAVPMRGVAALFGPSGCGKTTILRCVAGLTRMAGRLSVGGDLWQDDDAGVFRRTHTRPIGYVFQEASLFPHLSVRGNLLYGFRRAARDRAPAAPGFDEIVDLLGIGHLLDRAPRALSGGERQRVAVGRALLPGPRLLLMDEPLAALDRDAKEEILPCLERLHRELSIPMLYVTHDIAEAERLADTLVLLVDGRVLASGPLPEVETDTSLPLLRAPDAAVTLDGCITAVDEADALTELAVAGGTLLVPGLRGDIGSRRRLRIGASDVSFVLARPDHSTILNCLPARVVSTAAHDHDNSQVNVVAALGADGEGARIVGRITRRSLHTVGLETGAGIFVQIKSVALVTSRS